MYAPAIIVAVVLLLTVPLWPWSKGWSWIPAAMIAMIAAIVWFVTVVTVLEG
ncbi:MAG: hypothetical protein ACI867_000302 [Glaciecola sp.]|jgi:hypothetical protein